jgi:hypothetical protein
VFAAAGVAVFMAVRGPASAATGSRARTVLLLGSQAVGPVADQRRAGRAEAFPFTAVRSGLARAVHLYIDTPNRARSVSAAIYADAGGSAGALLTEGTLSAPRPGAWNTIFVRSAHIRAGMSYWLALLGSGGTLAFRDRRSAACAGAQARQSGLPSLPANWSTGARGGTCSVSAYLSGPRALGGPRPFSPAAAGERHGCFSAPGACGYPDPAYANVGPSTPCSSLAPSKSLTVLSDGQTIHDLNVTGTITIDAANVTIDNVCVTADGGGQIGSAAVSIEHGRDTVIENTTIAGAGPSDHSVQIAVTNGSRAPATLSHDYLYNCGECIHEAPWTVNDSYVIANGMQGTSDHIEALYCSDASISLAHDTLLNPASQTAVVFCDTGGGSGGPCDNHLTLADSLLAGGGYMLYPCANASSAGTSSMSITGNHFARCTAAPVTFDPSSGGHACGGSRTASIGSGADAHGYWPSGGYFGVSVHPYCPPTAGQAWSGNVWDDSGASIAC